MAGLWQTMKQAARALVYGTPERPAYTPPLERRFWSYALDYALPTPIKAGTLVHGPGATAAYRDATGAADADNSAVAACLNAVARAYNEVPLRHYRLTPDGEPVAVAPSPLDALLRRPNPAMTLRQLRSYWVWSKHLHGNAYLWKTRARNPDAGPVVELWPIAPALITPIRYQRSTNFIDAYRYWPDGRSTYVDIPVANIVHFKLGMDDENHALGISNLRRLAREIATDRAATRAADRLLLNKGGASLVVEYDKDATVGPDEARAIKAQLIADFTGDNLGAIGVLSPGGKAQQLGFSPKDLDLTALHRVPEERIAAVIGIPAILAGLGAGLDRATYSNARELREFFTEQFLIPEWLDDGETLTHQLLPDFVADADSYLGYDIAEARALQQDNDALTVRIVTQWEKGVITRDQALVALGYPPVGGAAGAERFAGGGVASPPPTPATGQARARRLETRGLDEERVAGLLAASRETLARETEAAMATYQRGQLRRVLGKVEAAG